jgi:curved DNA-binding protein CbpA
MTRMAEKVPRIAPNVDIRKFKLDPMDGFLLTRVDGKLGAKELARETGLPDFSVERALEKLEKLGVIERVDPNAPVAPPPPPPEKPRSALGDFSESLEAKYDPKELDSPADLSPAIKKRILDMYFRLDDLDHYTLLGVTKEVDKKAVKRAYFELAAHFHPDKYFKKNLGTFKSKMEILFTRVTEAHDTLVDPQKRAEYDAYIAEVATTRGMEAMLERAMAESRAAAEHLAANPVTPPAPFEPAPPSVPPVPAEPTEPTPSQNARDLQARREMLARRLLGQRPNHVPAPKPSLRPQAPASSQTSFDAMESLKKRYEQKIENATLAQARKYVAAADDAIAKKDVVAAASSLSIAMKFAPEDAAIAARYKEVKADADKTLCESYTKQAQYEERQHHWVEAGRSWVKVAKLDPQDAKAASKAAMCIFRSPEPDLHEASEFAKQAVALAPSVIEHHILLAEIYFKAGKAASAKRASETAEKLDPKNVALVALLKRMQKGA